MKWIGRLCNMHNKFTVSITEETGSKHYELHKIVKSIIIYSAIGMVVFIPASILSILHLNRSVHSFAGKYAFAIEANSSISKETEIMIKELKEIDGKIGAIEELIGMESPQGLSLAERLKASGLALVRREKEFKEIGDKIENIEEMIGLKMPDDTNMEQRVDLASLTAMQRKMMLDSLPSGCPLEFKKITSRYGLRTHPIYMKKEFHPGVDLRAKMNTPIKAVADGVVSYAGFHKRSGFGKLVVIRHNFAFSTNYGHLKKYIVKTGEIVKKGQLIGYTGNSGISNGPHLHYEVRFISNSLNPEPFTEWGMDNYEVVFRKVKGVKWQSLINLVNQRLTASTRQSLQLALK